MVISGADPLSQTLATASKMRSDSRSIQLQVIQAKGEISELREGLLEAEHLVNCAQTMNASLSEQLKEMSAHS